MVSAVSLDVRIALDTRVLQAIPLAVCLLEVDMADSRTSTLKPSGSSTHQNSGMSARTVPWPRGTT
jgi:hypothetical protein